MVHWKNAMHTCIYLSFWPSPQFMSLTFSGFDEGLIHRYLVSGQHQHCLLLSVVFILPNVNEQILDNLQLNIHKVGLVCRGSLWNLDDMHANSLRFRQINYREAPCHSNIALMLLSNKEIVFIFFECTLPRQFYSLCHHHLYCSTNVHFVVYLLVKEQMKLGIKNKWLFCTQ